MATIVYKNAKVFINDAMLDTALNDLSVDTKAEILDVTVFGNDTRIHKGGLYVDSISGKGFVTSIGSAGNIDGFLFANIGLDEGTAASGRPTVITVFANGITEGSLTDMGFAMKGVLETFTYGGAVGIALPVSFAVQGRGVLA